VDFRAGVGFDLHRFGEANKKLIIGGIEIPYGVGLISHSDGDVLLHSISDAILGAAGCGDIGDYFNNTDKNIKGISSVKITKYVLDLVKGKGYLIVNIDCVLMLDRPRLFEYKGKIVESLKRIFSIEAVNLKVKSFEGLYENQIISAYSVVLVQKGNI
jgi:2-C-methyl-D-erythritol 2,4-cyclodiphosphate synthase